MRGGMRVLVVEDELKMAGLIRRGLVEEGHAADVASTGEDAIWMAQAHPYDAIVLDVMLPRLTGVERPAAVEVGDLRLDPAERRAWRGEDEIALSPKEFALLETFMRRPGQVLSRLQLLEHAWDFAYENRSNIVDVYVRYLREKLDRPFARNSLETVRGAGYRLREEVRS